MSRPLWGHPVGHDDPACRRRFPPWRAGEPPTKVGGLRGDILFESKEYPLALPKKDSGGVCVVTSSLSLAAAQRAPAHSFRCSSFSHRKTLRREPYFRPQTPPTTKGRAAPFFGNHPGVYGDFCYEGRWNRERKMRAGCLWSFQAFHLAGDEVGDGLVDLEPAFVDCRGGALSPPGFWGLMDVL